jgi:hypothetical protein
MVKAGAIVFVPHDGGQAEIVGNPNLLFACESDAVAKIHRVLQSPALQSALRSGLSERAQCYSTSSFINNIQEFVKSFMQKSAIPEDTIGVERP